MATYTDPHPAYAAAREVATATASWGHTRGDGIAVTDAELQAWCAVQQLAFPGCDGRSAQEVAYWLCRYAQQGARFKRAWFAAAAANGRELVRWMNADYDPTVLAPVL